MTSRCFLMLTSPEYQLTLVAATCSSTLMDKAQQKPHGTPNVGPNHYGKLPHFWPPSDWAVADPPVGKCRTE